MAKKNKTEKRSEIAIERKLGGKSKTDPAFARGDAFVEEHTGSATMVNLDGRWDFGHPVEPKEK